MKVIVIQKFTHERNQRKIKDAIIRNKKILDTAYRHNETVYYLDECMFTVKTFMKSDWSPKRMNVTVKSSEFNT